MPSDIIRTLFHYYSICPSLYIICFMIFPVFPSFPLHCVDLVIRTTTIINNGSYSLISGAILMVVC